MPNLFRRRAQEKTADALQRTSRTFLSGVASLFGGQRLDEGVWDSLEEALVSADVGLPAARLLLERTRARVQEERISAPQDVLAALKREMVAILESGRAGDPLASADTPLVVLVAGVNGTGKTTSIAKLAHMYRQEGRSVVLGAADTFRAAAIEQLQAWGRRLEVEVIAQRSGADPGAVAYDTVQAALARRTDVAIIDTAGRLHTKSNLMDELRKIQRVASRLTSAGSQKVLLTLDATTGQNGLAQARAFTEAVRCDGVFLAKLDGTARGGVVFSIAHELKLPVLFIGTGEQPEDIAPFEPHAFVEALFGSGRAIE